MVHVNEGGLKLNGTQQLLAYVIDVNLLCGSLHTKKKNTEFLVVATKETAAANITKYTVGSRDQNAELSDNIKINSRAFERVEEIKYLRTTLINSNSIQEEIKSRVKSGKAYHYSV
jgi:hypothetical protein